MLTGNRKYPVDICFVTKPKTYGDKSCSEAMQELK